MADFAKIIREDQRLVILRLLAESPGYASNSSVLTSALEGYGHAPTRDQVEGHLAWLAEQDLIKTERMGSVIIATITGRGLDVAQGKAKVPGVKQPGPGL